MKKMIKILLMIAGIIVLLVILIFVLLLWMSKQPAVKENYWKEVTSTASLEQKYTSIGNYKVSTLEQSSEEGKIGKFKIRYPSEISLTDDVFPAVVMANGTGVPSSKYEAVFEHLASWGFIVIGNEDGSSWDGESSAESLNLLLQLGEDKDSILFGKVDTENIGIAGHSQGGVGAINAVTTQENGYIYKALYTASTTHIGLANALSWPYDVSKISLPYFMNSGTLQADAGNEKDVGIAPLSSLQENYNAVSDDVAKVYARRVNADHGDMLALADGYMTAWFMYWLYGDEEAGKVFIGDDAEILNNSNWQDIEKNF